MSLFSQDLHALALTYNVSRSLWSRSNLHASQRKFLVFGHLKLVVNCSMRNGFFDNLREWVGERVDEGVGG